MKLAIIVTIILFPIVYLNAQDYSSDYDFFRKKSQDYQILLNAKGLGEVLKVEDVQFQRALESDSLDYSELELIITINSTAIDTAIGMWRQLSDDFNNSDDSLTDYLFRMFIHKMEIPEKNGNVQIYFKDKLGRFNTCFYVWIWSENGRTISEEMTKSCKSKPFVVTIEPTIIDDSGHKKSDSIEYNRSVSADRVFNSILDYVDKKIKDPKYGLDLQDRIPIIESDSMRSQNVFKFTVANLGKEVFIDQNRTWWETIINITTIAIERLTFEFEYISIDDKKFKLLCTINGKYGSGIFKPRVSGYIDMEPEFSDLLESYIHRQRVAIVNHLKSIYEE